MGVPGHAWSYQKTASVLPNPFTESSTVWGHQYLNTPWNQHRGHQMGSSGLRYWASYEPLTPRSQEAGTMEPPRRRLEEEGGRMCSLDMAAATQVLTMVPPVIIWNGRKTLYPLKRSPVKTVLPYWKTNKYTPSTHQSVHDMFCTLLTFRSKISRKPRK